jgi:hypothetical protein
MTLTFRPDHTLESALERYCAEGRLNRSLVAQQALADSRQAHSAEKATVPERLMADAAYRQRARHPGPGAA